MLSIIKNLCLTLLMLFLLAGVFILFHEEILEFQYFIGYSLSSQYQKDRELIQPYFDEKFYLKHYGEAVKKSGLAPIDHFLTRGWYSNDWRNHTDPNPWFNTTLYQERLGGKPENNVGGIDRLISIFRIKPNPFVEFLTQPKLNQHQTSIEVWTNKEEIPRAWLAIEGLIRLDKFNVRLHLPKNITPEDSICFIPQVKRGLVLLLDNQHHKSFYHSDFIRHPSKYKLTDLTPKREIPWDAAITYIQQDFGYLMHRLYGYTDWMQNGKINPAMINIAHYCDEPLIHAPHLRNISQRLAMILTGLIHGKIISISEFYTQNFKDYLVRIADGFDLCLINTKLPIKNLKIIPGYMSTWINEQELAKNKEFSVSFLLTKQNTRHNKWNYALRNEVWEKEQDFKIPTRFYLSYRDKDNFPKKLQNRVMPTNSKKWVFNSAFNIAIENIRQEYYFTEKLLGCFVALTVPIYLGCPNVSDYFDPRGMIIVESVDELIKTANSLTPKTYQKMLPYLKENKKQALRLLRLEKDILTEFSKKLSTIVY